VAAEGVSIELFHFWRKVVAVEEAFLLGEAEEALRIERLGSFARFLEAPGEVGEEEAGP